MWIQTRPVWCPASTVKRPIDPSPCARSRRLRHHCALRPVTVAMSPAVCARASGGPHLLRFAGSAAGAHRSRLGFIKAGEIWSRQGFDGHGGHKEHPLREESGEYAKSQCMLLRRLFGAEPGQLRHSTARIVRPRVSASLGPATLTITAPAIPRPNAGPTEPTRRTAKRGNTLPPTPRPA